MIIQANVHIDLFSGIGLFSYAADHVWNLEHIFCEIEDWPYRFLKQEYQNARIERDIKTFDGTEYAGGTFLLTAGVPCQPASVAGKRKGTADDRWLWPEALRVMAEAQPEWCIFENPLGILTLEKGLVFENLVLEMESQGYVVQPYIIPAGGVSAVHRRYRVWIVANAIGRRFNGERISIRRERQEKVSMLTGANKNASPNAKDSIGGGMRRRDNGSPGGSKRTLQTEGSSGDVADTKYERCKEQLQPIAHERNLATGNVKQDYWQTPWPEVATELCRVDVSSTDRVHRLKALGNTIQWEVAFELMKGIARLPTS